MFINLKDESFIKREGRQLVFKSLTYIVDIYENNAYAIQQELKRQYGGRLRMEVMIASVRDTDKVDALESGLGALIDADLAKESARLQSLQIKQQLGTQALSIANQAPQTLLSLFR